MSSNLMELSKAELDALIKQARDVKKAQSEAEKQAVGERLQPTAVEFLSDSPVPTQTPNWVGHRFSGPCVIDDTEYSVTLVITDVLRTQAAKAVTEANKAAEASA